MDEGSEHASRYGTERPERFVPRIRRKEKRLRGRLVRDRRIVELMAAKASTCGTERAVAREPERAIAEMELSCREGGLERQEPGHGVSRTRRIHQALAQNHIAAALAIYCGTAGGGGPQAGEKIPLARKPSGMELGIAARKIDRIRVLDRRLVGERGEGKELGPLRAPTVQEVRIGEGEGVVAGQRHPLAKRGQRDRSLGGFREP